MQEFLPLPEQHQHPVKCVERLFVSYKRLDGGVWHEGFRVEVI